VGALVLAIAAWILLRKTPKAVVAIVVVLAATVLIAERSRIRPQAAVRRFTVRTYVAPGIADHLQVWRSYGTTPLTETTRVEKTSITGDYGKLENAEVRTSETPPSMGQLIHFTEWDAVSRWSYQREVGSAALTNQPFAAPNTSDYHSPIWFRLSDRRGKADWSR